MKLENLMNALTKKGIRVCGTTKDFNHDFDDNGIWIAADSTPDLFEYWCEGWINTYGVEPKLNAFVEDNGWYFEWYDPGTMMCWPQ